jgi:hypothetical protein
MYGHRWSSSYGTEVDPARVWEAALSAVTDEQIKNGLRACVERNLEWPPTAPQFLSMCKPKYENAEMYKPILPALEKTTWAERRAHAKIGIAVAKRILDEAMKNDYYETRKISGCERGAETTPSGAEISRGGLLPCPESGERSDIGPAIRGGGIPENPPGREQANPDEANTAASRAPENHCAGLR